MMPIIIPTTIEELYAVSRELDAAHFFECQAEDSEEHKRASDRIAECENAIDASGFEYDGDGNPIAQSNIKTAKNVQA